jgi:HAD superfamily hydrolase (TIGR01509 family)
MMLGMNKAFLFDMDGVLIHSEPVWEELERETLPQVFGADIAAKMGSLVGLGVVDVVERARSLGATITLEDYLPVAHEMAVTVYETAPITDGLENLARRLRSLGFRLGVVSQSPEEWISRVIPRLTFNKELDIVLSLQGHPDLRRKPNPDGYVHAIASLGSSPANSFVLEDSNIGIQAGKASGAYTIGYRGNLVLDYTQTGADAYADTMAEVQKIVENTIRP